MTVTVYDKNYKVVLYRGHPKGHELVTMVILPSTLGAMCPPSSSIRRQENEDEKYLKQVCHVSHTYMYNLVF